MERQIQYLRSSFFAARSFRDLDDLNAQFERWRAEIAHPRRVPGEPALTVAAALERERAYLLPLPEHALETDLMRVVSSGKTPYLRFDRNLYSIQHALVRKPLTLVASATLVRVLDGEREVARHGRSFESGVTIEDPAHLAGLVRAKQQARELTGRDRLRATVPESIALFETWALRGEPLGYHATRLLKLLDDYGAEELRAAIQIAVERGAPASGSIAHVLEQRRRARGLTPPVAIDLSHRPELRDLRLIPHRLEDYDALGQHDHDSDDVDPNA